MTMFKLCRALPLFLLLATPALAADNAWINDSFKNAQLVTGPLGALAPNGNYWTWNTPVFVKNAQCQGGYYCQSIMTPYANGLGAQPARAAFEHVTISNQIVDGGYSASIWTSPTGPACAGCAGDPPFDLYLNDVTITPNWPPWVNYQTTNFDGITADGGLWAGHIYAQDLNINGWDDAAIDMKGAQLQAVRLHTEGSGFNTLKLWGGTNEAVPPVVVTPTVIYLVNSTINNDRYNPAKGGAHPIAGATDGGLLWTWNCSTLVLNVYNTTFNGASTLNPLDLVCEVRGAAPVINYLTVDPTTTGEMHAMFGVPPVDQISPGTTGTLSINVPETWSFGTAVNSAGDAIVLRSGVQAGSGYGDLMVKRNNQISVRSSVSGWYLWSGTEWNHSSDPR
jgi:hypothetical protein